MNHPPNADWHEQTCNTITEWENMFGIKVLEWVYYGSRSSGIVHKCSTWCVDFLFTDPMQRSCFDTSFLITKKYKDGLGLDFNGVCQDKHFTYQDFRGRNIQYVLECMKDYSELFYNTPEDSRIELAKANEQMLFNAYILYIHRGSPLVYDRSEYFNRVSVALDELFDPKLTHHFYIYLIEKNKPILYSGEFPKLHSYLYTLRALFGGLWVIKYKTHPPSDMARLLDGLEEDRIKSYTTTLLKFYATFRDKEYKMPRDIRLDTYIDETQKSISGRQLNGKAPITNKQLARLV